MTDFLKSIEATEVRNCQALEAYRTSYEQSIKNITKVHTKAMDDMQVKARSSFNRMKYLEKMFANVLERITSHLDVKLPAILSDVVGKGLTPTLMTMLAEYLSPTTPWFSRALWVIFSHGLTLLLALT